MKIIRESADTLCSTGLYMGPTVCIGGKKIAGYDSPDGYAFGLDRQQGKMKVSKAGESHASMDQEYETELGWEDEYENLYEGRLWLDHKVITFWKYPPVDEFEKIIKLIQEELKRKEGVDIDMWNDTTWRVEVILSPIDGKPSWDSNFSSIVPMQYSTVLLPLKQYGGSTEVKRVPHEASPMDPSRQGATVPHGFGSKHPKAESRAKWCMAKPFESFVPKSLEECGIFQ